MTRNPMLQTFIVCALMLLLASSAGAVTINEIRVDDESGEAVQDDRSEYFELYGFPGESLNGLTYIVIGDNAANNSGVIEAVVPLGGRRIPADRAFLAAASNFSLGGSLDMAVNLNFEDSDNLTHLLVRNFTGFDGQRLDNTGDCTLDVRPWSQILDGVAFEEPRGATECHYGAQLGLPVTDPDGFSVARHIRRATDGNGRWVVSDRNPAAGLDSPGRINGQPIQLPALLLRDGRFSVTAEWNDFQGNSDAGNPSALTSDSGTFWFFDEANIEVVIKVLDGCGINGNFWVFAAGLTNVGVVLTVEDNQTGQVNVYSNNLGDEFQPIQDIEAFATCP